MQRSPQLMALVRPQMQMQWVVWGALVASVLLYGGLGIALSLSGGMAPAHFLPPMVAAAAGLLAATASVVVPQRLLDPERLKAATAQDPRATFVARAAGTQSPDPAKVAAIDALDERERRLLTLIQPAFTAMIVGQALAEVVAILGLIQVISDQEPMAYLPYAVVSLTLHAMHRPQIEAVWERASRVA